VLDGTNTAPHSILDTIRALRVRHDVDPCGSSLNHHHRKFFGGEMRAARVTARADDPTRGGDLDDVGAGADQFSDLAAHLVDAVDNRRRAAGVGRPQGVHALARWHPFVGVAAGLAEHTDRDLHVGAVDQPGGHRLFDAEVRAGGISDSGHSGVQGQPQVADCLKEPERERTLDQP